MTTHRARTTALALAAALAAILAPAAPALAGTEFLTYEGRDAIQDGQGGNKKIVGGVDFWLTGTPPHRYQVLGLLVDERWESGLYGAVRLANLQSDIARRARAAGGDAVILQEQHDHIRGVSTAGITSSLWINPTILHLSTTHASPYGTKASRFVVVKYLPDLGAEAAAPMGVTSSPHLPVLSQTSSAGAADSSSSGRGDHVP